MVTLVLRVWLPDRPGALGAVASRVGAVRGDLVGIDILERSAGVAVDELVVHLPDDALVPLLVREVRQVDGVEVEEVRSVAGGTPDPRLAALQTAALLVEQPSAGAVADALAAHAAHDFEAAWAAVVDTEKGALVAAAGDAPPLRWLCAFVAGTRSCEHAAPADMAWAPLRGGSCAVVLGRPGRAFRVRERSQLLALSRIAGLRWCELARREGLRAHPSAG